MADMEKPKISDPEKAVELSRNITSGDGEVKDAIFIHADPNDGDEAYVTFSHTILRYRASRAHGGTCILNLHNIHQEAKLIL